MKMNQMLKQDITAAWPEADFNCEQQKLGTKAEKKIWAPYGIMPAAAYNGDSSAGRQRRHASGQKHNTTHMPNKDFLFPKKGWAEALTSDYGRRIKERQKTIWWIKVQKNAKCPTESEQSTWILS